MSDRMETAREGMAVQKVPGPALWLGLAGLIPFFALAIAVSVNSAQLPQQALVGYGAVILSFMGGCRWGFAAAGLGDGPNYRLLAISVVPALYAWIAALLDFRSAVLALGAGFVALYAADWVLERERGAPAWWTRLRLPLSTGATVSLAVAGAFSA